jgi:hypothetical protein
MKMSHTLRCDYDASATSIPLKKVASRRGNSHLTFQTAKQPLTLVLSKTDDHSASLLNEMYTSVIIEKFRTVKNNQTSV